MKHFQPTGTDLTLEHVFASNLDRPWIFVRPGGNWGDHLIYAGAESLATRVGLKWATYDSRSFRAASTSPDHCIYLHGGGGYNSWGSGRPFQVFADAVSREVSLVVQGPQTLESSAEVIRSRLSEALQRMDAQRVVFFSREPYSLSVLQELRLSGVEVAIDHDTAFHLERHEILQLASVDKLPEGRYDLTAYREDDEQPGGSGSTPARGVVLDPAYVAESFGHWLRIHLYARSLLTNRLHSGIVSALLGKPVTIAFGGYHKNRSIWSYSLAQRGVEWTEGIYTGRRLWDSMPRRVRESYKLRKLRFALQRLPLR